MTIGKAHPDRALLAVRVVMPAGHETAVSDIGRGRQDTLWYGIPCCLACPSTNGQASLNV